MPRNVLKDRSDRDLAAEYVLRLNDSTPPTKLYGMSELFIELASRGDGRDGHATALIEEAKKTARILGD